MPSMPSITFNKDEQERFKRKLKFDFGSLGAASSKLDINPSTLSRILHGSSHDLYTHVKLRIAVGDLKPKKYRFPKVDYETFKILNKL